MKLIMVLLTGSYQNVLAHITHIAGIHMHLQLLGTLRHDLLYWNFHATYNTSAA